MLQRIHGYNLIKHHQEALIPQQMYGIKPENGGNFVSDIYYYKLEMLSDLFCIQSKGRKATPLIIPLFSESLYRSRHETISVREKPVSNEKLGYREDDLLQNILKTLKIKSVKID